MKLVIEGETPDEIYSHLVDWVEWYGQAGATYAVTASPSNGNTPVQPQAQQAQQTGLGPAPRCQNCGGEVYDNRQDRKGNGPHFRCKSCKWGGWVGKDGTISWKAPINA